MRALGREQGRYTLPKSLLQFILRVSAADQIWLALLSAIVFLVGTGPLEVQRRIINDALVGNRYGPIASLCGIYFCFALTEGCLKLILNIYRGRVSEKAVRLLRSTILMRARRARFTRTATERGIDMSMVLAEAEPIGGFTGSSISEPVLQAGILISTLAYLTYLQPLMAVVTFGILFPQIFFVPVIQNAINQRVKGRISTLREVSGSMIAGENRVSLQPRRLKEIFVLNVSVYKLKFAMNFLMNILTHSGITAIFALGGYYIIKGDTELGTVVAFVSGLARINDPWGDLVNWFRDLRMTQAKYELVYGSVEKMISP
jgi:ABC-type bacteriocin/lantibiotic exporter with double-glycine peptidase domain